MIRPHDEDAQFRMMSTPEEWPVWPFLPLKKVEGGQLRTAVLYSPYTKDDTVFFVPDKTLYDKLARVDITRDSMADRKKLRQLVDEGWRVD